MRPGAAARTGHALAVQLVGDLARRTAQRVAFEDVAHPACLVFVDHLLRSLAIAYTGVAVGQAAGAVTVERLPHQSAVRLLGQVVEVELGHQAAQAGLQLVAVALGVDAVGHTDHANAGELQAPDRLRAFDVIARQPRQIVDQQHVEGVDGRRVEHGLVAGPVAAGAADRLVLVQRRRRPAHALAVNLDVAQLVADRRLALGVGRKSAVGGDSHFGAGFGCCGFRWFLTACWASSLMIARKAGCISYAP
ncbi:MAG: hypothetical protein WBG17_05290 [Burkholderiaceae bacterium]